MDKLPQVVLLLESSRGAGRALLRGFVNYARHHGPWAFNWEPGGLNEIRPGRGKPVAQGIFLRDGKHIRKILALGIPTVVVGHRREHFPDVAHVVTDSAAAGRLAAEHLLGCGFKHFAFYGPSRIRWSAARRDSFQRSLEPLGREIDFFDAPVEGEGIPRKAGHVSVGRWLKSLPKPVGVMACNDDYAHHLVEACKTVRLHVPDQVGIIGVDNDELVCELSAPTISSVAINFERAGYESACLLDEWMHKGRISLPARIDAPATHVVPRMSTNILAVDDPHLLKALSFIRDHARENVRVSHVARAAGLSRRALENRFRRELERSILQEIRRVRIGLIARMLLETDLPVSDIAEELGFKTLQHVARYFRKDKNMSLMAYRKHFGAK
jgi:LacI family transcriptional regulator